MESLKIDRTKLITQSEYAKMINKTRGAVNHMVREQRVKTVKIKGAILVCLD
jgi:hypothetical protein